MTDDKQKLNGCAVAVIIAAMIFVIPLGVTVFWILLEFGQWIGRQ
jgi:hypothetical protein